MINFIRARAAGILSRGVGPVVSAAAAPAVPDFAFQNGDRQQTLSRILQDGPALVALFSRPPASGRVAQLAAAQKQLQATGLNILAIDLGSASGAPAETAASPPFVEVAADVAAALALFRAPDDGGETDLMLDRAANVRARWTAAAEAAFPMPPPSSPTPRASRNFRRHPRTMPDMSTDSARLSLGREAMRASAPRTPAVLLPAL